MPLDPSGRMYVRKMMLNEAMAVLTQNKFLEGTDKVILEGNYLKVKMTSARSMPGKLEVKFCSDRVVVII